MLKKDITFSGMASHSPHFQESSKQFICTTTFQDLHFLRIVSSEANASQEIGPLVITKLELEQRGKSRLYISDQVIEKEDSSRWEKDSLKTFTATYLIIHFNLDELKKQGLQHFQNTFGFPMHSQSFLLKKFCY